MTLYKKLLLAPLLLGLLAVASLTSGADKTANFSFVATPGNVMGDYCSYLDIELRIEGFGTLPLDEGVCVKWTGLDDINTPEEWAAFSKKRDTYLYNAEDARDGIDTDTLRVTVAGDKALVEWQTIPQGSGGHITHQYSVYSKGRTSPLLSRKIKVHARGGADSSVVEELTVKRFTPNSLEVQVDCTKSDFVFSEKTGYSWDEFSQSYASRTNLRSTATYRFFGNDQTVVSKARFLYKDGPLKSKQEVAKAFQVGEKDVWQQEGSLEITLNKERFDKLFSPLREETANSLYDLTNPEIY